uniref:DNA2/NAM7 helicase-like C-terminal domain-containing protein n=1 Tax=Chromera velia CCMP2878 TaxID=1169474 RepID=A0A0G4FXY1_9ALVE|eukprot:Cvel_3897.t1-p1 / transcript=Cvel_3897.t1 / gene=Cvel_3897 / organism=Chromera_velia_CCMP2878 / gene_product=Helicase sen1, putative / transcript_product=Helicase sen1, putative / location=Cvel_scaffold165:31967-33475(+) / protein_length=503 / sequence_SO=supercontig / SO=protein_coding / is_pseudo=false
MGVRVVCLGGRSHGFDEAQGGFPFRLTLEGRLEALRQAGSRTHAKDGTGRRVRSQRFVQKVIRSAEVICATCAASGEPALLNCLARFDLRFELLLIDEATQASELSTWVPLSVAAQSEHVCLIGDQMQLPPTVIGVGVEGRGSQVRGEGGSYNHNPPPSTVSSRVGNSFSHESPPLESLKVSLFHSLAAGVLPVFLLDVQHRMHPALSAYPNETFYAGRLKDAPGLADTRVPPEFPWPHDLRSSSSPRPLMLLDVQEGRERRGMGGSLKNEREAEVVVQLVRRLIEGPPDGRSVDLSKLVPADQVAVLTPYRAQVHCIQQKLSECGLASAVPVRTVDGFQGQERDVVVFSLVRSGPSLGFATSPERVNVLLTRCRRGLIGVLNRQAFESSEVWGEGIRRTPSRSPAFLSEGDEPPSRRGRASHRAGRQPGEPAGTTGMREHASTGSSGSRGRGYSTCGPHRGGFRGHRGGRGRGTGPGGRGSKQIEFPMIVVCSSSSKIHGIC